MLSKRLHKGAGALPLRIRVLCGRFRCIPTFTISSVLIVLTIVLLVTEGILRRGKGKRGNSMH